MKVVGIIALLLGHLAAGIVIVVYAFTVDSLGTAWWVNTGLLVGLLLARKLRRRALIVPALLSLALLAAVLCRFLPIYSLDVGSINEIQITHVGDDWHILLTDREEIDAFVAYLQNGSYQSMVKSGYGYHVYLTQRDAHGSSSTGYYIHGNAIGSSPGGRCQSVFVPRKAGFLERFEQLLERHGHPRRAPGD